MHEKKKTFMEPTFIFSSFSPPPPPAPLTLALGAGMLIVKVVSIEPCVGDEDAEGRVLELVVGKFKSESGACGLRK